MKTILKKDINYYSESLDLLKLMTNDFSFEDLKNRLKEKDITIEVTNSAKDVMVREGYDPVYGARPLKRYIGNTLETIIAKKLIAGDVYNGCTIVIDGKDENIEVLVK